MSTLNFCPRCGHSLERREMDDHRVRPVCPNCHYVLFLNPPLAAGVVATRQGRVVLVRRGEEPGRGLWGLPAGFMEVDETTEEAARRECLEETGLIVELRGLWGVWSYLHAHKRTAGVLVLYRAEITGGVPEAGTDSTEVKFFGPDEIPLDELAFETHKEALRRWRESVTNRVE